MKLELRPMTDGEYEAFIRRNVSRYAQELLLTKKTDVEQHALAEAQGALEEILSKGRETPLNYLLAAENASGTPVGEVWCDTTEPETVFINDFYVFPAHRKQGCADAMLRAVEQIAVEGAFQRVMTHVYHANKTAVSFFTKRGYLPVGGETEGTLFLERRLAQQTEEDGT